MILLKKIPFFNEKRILAAFCVSFISKQQFLREMKDEFDISSTFVL